MGDLPSPATPGAGHGNSPPQQDGEHTVDGADGIDGASLVVGKQQQDLPQQTPQAQDPGAPKHAFSSQFDMASSPPAGRPGPYNMANIANALPQPGYRSGQSPQGAQQRYNPVASPPMMHQMPQMPQYTGHAPMPMANQGYYVQQPQMPQYYGPSQLSPTQPQSIPPRQPMAYYPNQMMNNPYNHPYYYQGNQYQGQAQPMHNVMAGQYVASSPTMADPRAMSQSPDGTMAFSTQRRGQGTFLFRS